MSEPLAASPVFHALGLTLVHFLWQGASIALLTAGALTLLARASASTRYVVACVGLLAMVLTPVMTGVVMTQLPPAQVPVFPTGGTAVTALDTAADAMTPGSAGFIQSARVALERELPLIVVLWALSVLALSARLVVGWLKAERIRHGALRVVPDVVQSAVTRLARELGLTQAPDVAESSLVDVPAVIGWLRPLILVPASALGQLSPWQLEAILAHEIAHVRRHDYFVNLLQCLLETLFFYHPGVWWLSSRVRAEREHCCDDVAVAVCGDRLNYARALTTLEAARHGALALGVAATGGPLLARVRRLLGEPEPTSRPISVAVVAATIVLIVAARATGYSTEISSQGPTSTSAAAVEARLPADQPASEPAAATDAFLQGQVREAERAVISARRASPADATKIANAEMALQSLQQKVAGPSMTAEQSEVIRRKFEAQIETLRQLSGFGSSLNQRVLSPDESAVLAAEEALRVARLRGDGAALERLLHGSSIDTRQNGATYDKRGQIVLFSGRFLTSLTIGPSTIKVQGNTATVNGSQVEVGPGGTDVVVFTRTWTREPGGEWTMLSGSQFKDPRASAGSTAVAPNTRLSETVTVQGQGTAPPAPPPPGAGAIVRVGGDVKEPLKIRDVRPVYPLAARDAKVQGLVIIEATIDPEGNVTSPRILRSVPMLDQAALDAVLQWKYVPSKLGGVPVSVIMTVTVNFMLPAAATTLPSSAQAPPPPPTGGVLRVGGEVKPPTKIRDVRPVYPADARDAGVMGLVIMEANIDVEGNVTGLHVLRSVPQLDEAALAAVRQWKYTPATLNGEPVSVIMTVTVNFTLPNSQ